MRAVTSWRRTLQTWFMIQLLAARIWWILLHVLRAESSATECLAFQIFQVILICEVASFTRTSNGASVRVLSMHASWCLTTNVSICIARRCRPGVLKLTENDWDCAFVRDLWMNTFWMKFTTWSLQRADRLKDVLLFCWLTVRWCVCGIETCDDSWVKARCLNASWWQSFFENYYVCKSWLNCERPCCS